MNMREFFDKFLSFWNRNFKFRIGIFLLVTILLIFKFFENLEMSMNIIIIFVVYIFSMTFHEIAHGYVAYCFGDDTAKNMERITLNPLKHVDLLGIIFPAVIFLCGFKFLIGWAKPVPVNFSKLTPQKKGIFCVCIAGVTVNFIFAAISLIVLRIIGYRLGINNIVVEIFIYLYLINLLLGIFNLIPITPLDGGRIVYFFSSEKIRKAYGYIEKYGVVIIILIVYLSNKYFSGGILSVFDFFLKLAGIDLSLDI